MRCPVLYGYMALLSRSVAVLLDSMSRIGSAPAVSQVHQLVAAKIGVFWKDAFGIIALMVPLSQLGKLSFSKSGLRL